MKKLLRHVRRVALAGAIAYLPMVLIHAFCITGAGGWVIAGVELFLLIPLGALAVCVCVVPLLLVERVQQAAFSWLIVCFSLVLLFLPALLVSDRLRTLGFELAAERAVPLIDAIERHVDETGAPPVSLDVLIPKYLPSVPAGLPDLEIITGETARREYNGNEWVLYANVSSGFINFDAFVYFPNQRYPTNDYGFERIARWAYLHE